jgi:hypothetical protein
MKVKHIIFWHTAITIGLVVFWLSGGRQPERSDAAWEAGRMWFKNPSGLVCRHRVAIIAKGMMERGETFDLVFGENSGGKHVWIEQYLASGAIIVIEPTQSDSSPQRYKETARMRWEAAGTGNILVVSTVNRWLVEKGMVPFSPQPEGQKGEGEQS